MPQFFQGIRTSALTNSAFDTGIQTGLINGLAFKQIPSVNYVYTIQESYNDYSTILLSGVINSDFSETEAGLKKFYSYMAISMTDIAIKEQQLIAYLNKLISRNKI